MNPIRHSQIERALSVLDKSGVIDILKDDQYLLFLFKKTERVVAALYIITGLFPDPEPLKWGIRESGTHLLALMLSLKERVTVHGKESISDTFAEMTRLFSLLDLAYVADLLSPMNFAVLKKELDGVLGIVEGKERNLGLPTSPLLFDERFFGIPKDIFLTAKEEKSRAPLQSSGSEEQRTKEGTTIHALGDFERFGRSIKDIHKGHLEVFNNVLKKKTSISVPKSRPGSIIQATVRPLPDRIRESRAQSIIAVLRQQRSAMIKDFSAVIKGCSEKTIQRLLIDMVQEGVLYREGHRRWSRYSLVSTEQKKIG